MWKIVLVLSPILLGMAIMVSQDRKHSVPEVRLKALDPLEATKAADEIVLAEPIARRDVRSLIALPQGRPNLQVAEVEVTLTLHQVLKGTVPPSEIRFRFYDSRGYAQFGLPRGASGPIGSKGIYFLRRDGDQFRSMVDVHRPYIATPWIRTPGLGSQCASPAYCIAEVLLGFQSTDDPAEFCPALLENVAISRQLTGFLATLDLLSRLVKGERVPPSVRSAACSEMQKWYVLEFPQMCGLAGEAPNQIAARTAKFRAELGRGGIAWVKTRIGSDSAELVQRYLRTLTESHDAETRNIASQWLKTLE